MDGSFDNDKSDNNNNNNDKSDRNEKYISLSNYFMFK